MGIPPKKFWEDFLRFMPTLVEIHPVVWAPNGNKQTNKQLSFIYIDIDPHITQKKRLKKVGLA